MPNITVSSSVDSLLQTADAAAQRTHLGLDSDDAVVFGTVTTSGRIFGQDLAAQSDYTIYWASRTRITAPTDGTLTLTNSASSSFTRINLGGATSSFPAIKRTGTDVEITRGDGVAAETSLILISPNGTRYKVGVSNAGAVTVTAA